MKEIGPFALAGMMKSPSYGGISIGFPDGMSRLIWGPVTVTVPVAPPDMAKSMLGVVGTSLRLSPLVAGDGPRVTLAWTLPPGSTTAYERSTLICCGPVASPCPAGRAQWTVGVTVPAMGDGGECDGCAGPGEHGPGGEGDGAA